MWQRRYKESAENLVVFNAEKSAIDSCILSKPVDKRKATYIGRPKVDQGIHMVFS